MTYLAALLALAAPAEPPKPNVLFIAVDDLRPSLGCYGDPHAKTPNIDRLAAGGVAFNRAYCQQAVCSPSRTSLLTGRRPDTTRIYDLDTHFRKHLPDVVTLPQHFKNNGYVTRGVGKIYHGGLDDERSWSAPHETPKAPGYGPEGRAVLAKLTADAKAKGTDLTDWRKRPRGLPWEAPEVADDELADGAAANRAIEILGEVKDRPFFLAVGFLKPHLPFVAPKKYWDRFDPEALPKAPHPDAPKGAPAFALHDSGELRQYRGMPKGREPFTAGQAKQLVHGYYAAASYTDAQIGRLLDALDRHGLRERTVVVLWGDHGWNLGDHGLWCKHCNYETSVRVPLVVSAPGRAGNGKRSDALVEFVDVYPTLAEVCGLPAPEGVEGLSFGPLLADPARPWKSAAFSQYPRQIPGQGKGMGYAMRTDRYRLVEWRVPGKDFTAHELYDHRTDPGEDVNLAGKPEHVETVKRLAAQLREGWRRALPRP